MQASFKDGALRPDNDRPGSAGGKRCGDLAGAKPTRFSGKSLAENAFHKVQVPFDDSTKNDGLFGHPDSPRRNGMQVSRGTRRVVGAPQGGQEVHGVGYMNRTAQFGHAGKSLEVTASEGQKGHHTHVVAGYPHTRGRAPLRAMPNMHDDDRSFIPTAPVGDSTVLSCAALRGRSAGRQGRGVPPVFTVRSGSAGRKAYDLRGDSSAMKQCLGQEVVPESYMKHSRLVESVHGSDGRPQSGLVSRGSMVVGFAAKGPDTPTSRRAYSAEGRAMKNFSGGVGNSLSWKES